MHTPEAIRKGRFRGYEIRGHDIGDGLSSRRGRAVHLRGGNAPDNSGPKLSC
jgi:hypothetical protein